MTKDKLLALKNKEFILECLKIINIRGSDMYISVLTNPSECKRRFDMNYPILQEVSSVGSVDKSMFLDNAGNRRYYPNVVEILNKQYIVCNDWYYNTRVNKRDTRSNFVDFILSI